MHALFSQRVTRAAVFMLCLLDPSAPAFCVPIVDDPNGFENIPWGTILAETDHFVKIEDAGRVQIYERSGRTPLLGPATVDSIRFTTFERKFGRVTIRYSGKETHEELLTYLQTKYGPLDRTPGQIAVGAVKVYAWHGMYTEVTLRFETTLSRGIIFFESRTLPEKLADETATTAF